MIAYRFTLGDIAGWIPEVQESRVSMGIPPREPNPVNPLPPDAVPTKDILESQNAILKTPARVSLKFLGSEEEEKKSAWNRLIACARLLIPLIEECKKHYSLLIPIIVAMSNYSQSLS